MSQRNRVFFGLLLIVVLGVTYLLVRILGDLDPRYRESSEDSMVDTAHIIASMVSSEIEDGVIHTQRLRISLSGLYARRFDAQIFGVKKTHVDLRIYVMNRAGTVIYDSFGEDEGEDFSTWRDVALTLMGQYGARTTLKDPTDKSSDVMFVAAPVIWKGNIVGVVSVGKPTSAYGQFLENARSKVIAVGVTIGVAALTLALTLLFWLMRPFELIVEYWRFIRSQQKLSLPRISRRFFAILGDAFNELRDTLAGRSHVEEYVQALTHEIKSPLSAIRGAAELLQEPMPEERRKQFLGNIESESRRIQTVVDRLLELAALERRRGLREVKALALDELISDVVTSLGPVADRKSVHVEVIGDTGLRVWGDDFLLHRALANLLHNAIDFSPDSVKVTVAVSTNQKTTTISVRDRGPGIPDYARGRIYERFYSLPRPDSGKKSTGLGLSFVKEIAALHRGSVDIVNHPEGGAVAALSLPRA